MAVTIFERVREVFVENFSARRDNFGHDTIIEDLVWIPEEIEMLIVELQIEFEGDVNLDAETLEELETVGSLVTHLENQGFGPNDDKAGARVPRRPKDFGPNQGMATEENT